MDRFEIRLADVSNIVRNVRAFPSEEPVPVVVFDPITGTWVIQWKIPEPQPDHVAVDYTKIPDDAVDELGGSIESLKSTGKPAELLLASADLLGHARELEAAGRGSSGAVLEAHARALLDLALTRMA